MKPVVLAAIGMALALSQAHAASDAEIRKMKVDMMIHTREIAVTNLSVPASQYKSDGDPDTLEIVFLTKPEDGPSRVSDDGEVIFLNNPTGQEQQDLINKAFDIRVQRRLAGQ